MIKEISKTTIEKKEKPEGYFIYKKVPEGQIGIVRTLGEEFLQKIEQNLRNIGGERIQAGGWRNKWVDHVQTEKGPLKFIIKEKENPSDYSRGAALEHRRLYRSVIHEIIINLKAQERYKEVYHEELPIEKPLGFFIAKNGDRFVIYEYIEGARQPLFNPDVYDEALRFAVKFRKILKKIGIDPQDLNETNVVYQKTEKGPKFWLIDTELWQYENRRRLSE